MPIIQTQRLKLRQLVETDVNALHEILGDAETMRFYPAPYDLEGIRRWIDRSRQSYRENGYGLWAVTLKDSNEFIGQCGILDVLIDGRVVPEIAYHIHRSFWNQGYATEAARACLEYGQTVLGLDALYIHTYVKNLPSRRVAEKIGMRPVNEYDKHMPAYGVAWRHLVYSCSSPG